MSSMRMRVSLRACSNWKLTRLSPAISRSETRRSRRRRMAEWICVQPSARTAPAVSPVATPLTMNKAVATVAQANR